ncbi:MAG TPA: hypothetical protein VM451_10045 [Candidatus Limnocylindria bacterium]|nr:hypothetical protein [Candidatus Limnocylindria bacterium]
MTDAYRSYMIRVRRRIEPPTAVRLELEDLLGGVKAAVSGPEAEHLADRLLALLHRPVAAASPDPRSARRPDATRDDEPSSAG